MVWQYCVIGVPTKGLSQMLLLKSNKEYPIKENCSYINMTFHRNVSQTTFWNLNIHTN